VAALAANGDGGMVTWPQGAAETYVPATATAAGACRHWPKRHVPRVAGQGVPPLVGGLF
jgi:hypothetical protein